MDVNLPTLTRRELVDVIAYELGITQAKASPVVQRTIFRIAQALQEHRRVEIRGLGSFEVVARDARDRRHPGTGEITRSRAQYVVRYKPSKYLRSPHMALALDGDVSVLRIFFKRREESQAAEEKLRGEGCKVKRIDEHMIVVKGPREAVNAAVAEFRGSPVAPGDPHGASETPSRAFAFAYDEPTADYALRFDSDKKALVVARAIKNLGLKTSALGYTCIVHDVTLTKLTEIERSLTVTVPGKRGHSEDWPLRDLMKTAPIEQPGSRKESDQSRNPYADKPGEGKRSAKDLFYQYVVDFGTEVALEKITEALRKVGITNVVVGAGGLLAVGMRATLSRWFEELVAKWRGHTVSKKKSRTPQAPSPGGSPSGGGVSSWFRKQPPLQGQGPPRTPPPVVKPPKGGKGYKVKGKHPGRGTFSLGLDPVSFAYCVMDFLSDETTRRVADKLVSMGVDLVRHGPRSLVAKIKDADTLAHVKALVSSAKGRLRITRRDQKSASFDLPPTGKPPRRRIGRPLIYMTFRFPGPHEAVDAYNEISEQTRCVALWHANSAQVEVRGTKEELTKAASIAYRNRGRLVKDYDAKERSASFSIGAGNWLRMVVAFKTHQDLLLAEATLKALGGPNGVRVAAVAAGTQLVVSVATWTGAYVIVKSIIRKLKGSVKSTSQEGAAMAHRPSPEPRPVTLTYKLRPSLTPEDRQHFLDLARKHHLKTNVRGDRVMGGERVEITGNDDSIGRFEDELLRLAPRSKGAAMADEKSLIKRPKWAHSKLPGAEDERGADWQNFERMRRDYAQGKRGAPPPRSGASPDARSPDLDWMMRDKPVFRFISEHPILTQFAGYGAGLLAIIADYRLMLSRIKRAGFTIVDDGGQTGLLIIHPADAGPDTDLKAEADRLQKALGRTARVVHSNGVTGVEYKMGPFTIALQVATYAGIAAMVWFDVMSPSLRSAAVAKATGPLAKAAKFVKELLVMGIKSVTPRPGDPRGRVDITHLTPEQLAQLKPVVARYAGHLKVKRLGGGAASLSSSGNKYPWNKCVSDMKRKYGSEESARNVCGKIKANRGASMALPIAAIATGAYHVLSFVANAAIAAEIITKLTSMGIQAVKKDDGHVKVVAKTPEQKKRVKKVADQTGATVKAASFSRRERSGVAMACRCEPESKQHDMLEKTLHPAGWA